MNAYKNKVLLLYPATDSEQFSLMPLSLLYVAQPLLEKGFEVTVIDQRLENDFFEKLRQQITPDLICIGITCITGPQIKQVIRMCEFIKKTAPAPIVLGGNHATLFPEQTVSFPLIDYVVAGRGEKPFLNLVKALRDGGSVAEITNVGRRENGQVVMRKGPLPEPEFHEIPYHLVARYGRPSTIHILSSYGCPYHCTFCAEKILHPNFFQLPAGDVVKMVEEALRLNPQFISFSDDNFLLNIKRIRELFSLCQKKGLVFQWVCTGRADVVLRLDDETLRSLKDRGMVAIYFGIESGSPGILKLLNKGITPEIVLKLNVRLKKEGITPHYSFMAGYPTETAEDFQKTVNLMKRLKEDNPGAVIWKINHFTPYPGTGMYELAVQHGYRTPEKLEEWSEAYFYSRDYGIPYDTRY